MNEEKAEGKIAGSDSGNIALSHEVDFDDKVDGQIASIENQLKKAQGTLLDLQNLKEKLEKERKKNLAKTNEDKERINAEKLKEENLILKADLKNYHYEINSLKHIIASLKDDLIFSSSQLQSKVADSLKILEEAESKIERKSHLVKEVEKKSKDVHKLEEVVELEKNIEIDKTPEKEEKETEEPENKSPEEAVLEAHRAAEIEDSIKNSAGEKVSEKIEEAPAAIATKEETTESKPVDKTTAETKDEPAAGQPEKEEEKNEEKKAETPEAKEEVAKVEEAPEEEIKTEEQPTQLEQKPETTAENAAVKNEVDAELNEYEKIKMELEALENGFMPNNNIAQTAAAPAVKIEWNGNDPYPGKKPKKFLGLFPMGNKKQKKENLKSTSDTTVNTIEQKNGEKETPKETEPEAPVQKPAPAQADGKKQKQIKIEEKNDKEKIGGLGKTAVKAAVVLLIFVSAYFTYQIKNAGQLREAYVSQARQNRNIAIENSGSSDSKAYDLMSKPPEERYKEAYADLPFENTIWDMYTASDLGISFTYPKNTSNKLQQVGSNNIWIIRKDGYLFKAQKIITETSLEQYVSNLKPQITYKVEATEWKGKIAVKLTPDENIPIMGTTYLIQSNGFILELWFKTIDDNNTDDQKRLEKMIDSFEFI